jgi:hypothetical protein
LVSLLSHPSLLGPKVLAAAQPGHAAKGNVTLASSSAWGRAFRTLDRPLDAPLVRMIRRRVAAVEEQPRHTLRLDESGFCRSMDRNETEATFGGHLHRCIDGVEPVTLAMNAR